MWEGFVVEEVFPSSKFQIYAPGELELLKFILKGAQPDVEGSAEAVADKIGFTNSILNTAISQLGDWLVAKASVVVANPPPLQTAW